MHDHQLQALRDNAPNKRNGSPQFPDDGLDAHAVHGGRKGNNKIDHKAGADIGQAMLEHLKNGDLEISSVQPKEFGDPAKLQKLIDDVRNGQIKQTRIETAVIAEEGYPRRKRLSIDMTGGPIPRIDIVYKLAG